MKPAHDPRGYVLHALSLFLLVIPGGQSAVFAGAIGNPTAGNGWSSAGAITATSSSSHGNRPVNRTIDGSGIDATGDLHQGSAVNGDPGPYMWMSGAVGPAVSRGGTVTGSHWIQFAFDQLYDLGWMWIWNYNEKSGGNDWTVQGMKEVTIEYSVTGSSNPADWTTIYDGRIQKTSAWTPSAFPWNTPVSTMINFTGTQARYVVITSDFGTERNWAGGGGGSSEVGLSEVRFFTFSPLTIAGNGTAQAFIVVDAAASVADSYAADELATFLGQVTGGTFPVYNSPQPGGPNLLVGPGAALLGDSGFTTAGLGEEGIEISRADDDLILAGGGTRGTLYAVYTFLEDLVGIHWWTPNAATVPSRPTLLIDAPDLTYIPPLEYRETDYGIALSGNWSARNKYNGHHHELEAKHGGRKYRYIATGQHFTHTHWTYLPPTTYFAPHPDWYALFNGVRDNRGLNLLNEDMRLEYMDNLRTFLLANPHATLVSISEIDNGVTSQDAASQSIIAQEGSPMGLLLRFVNSIAADLEGEFPGVTFQTLAYQDTFQAPQITTPRSNVIIRLTNIQASFSVPLNDPRNSSFAGGLAQWKLIADPLYLWDYVANFCNPVPHPNLRVLGPNLQFLAENGVTGMFEEGAPVTEMWELRSWVLGQLLWDPYRDADALMETFANGYYGPAGPHVLAYLDSIHDAVEAEGDYLSFCSSASAGFLGFEYVTAAFTHLAAAEEAVDNDPVLWPRLQTFVGPAVHALERYGRSGNITLRASSTAGNRNVESTVDGSGLTADGGRHISLGNPPQFGINAWESGSGIESSLNPRGGTVSGTHWIEFARDAPTSLGEMWIWNYHEYIPGSGIDNRALGCRQVTIQHSMTGSGNPADWTTVFTGEIPKTLAVAEAPVSLVVDFQAAPAKYIVITTGSGSSRNWSAGALDEVALSEVGFSPHVITASFFPAVIPNVVEMTFTGENERDYRLEYVTDPLQQNWTFSGLVLHFTGESMTVFDPGWASSFKLYRLVLE